jgi:hypothetical protein
MVPRKDSAPSAVHVLDGAVGASAHCLLVRCRMEAAVTRPKRKERRGCWKRPSAEDRFWSRVDKNGPFCDYLASVCWLWTGYTGGNGYGKLRVQDRHIWSHRFSYEMAHGTIPAGMTVDHACHRSACVNPDHLRLATYKQNSENRAGADTTNASSGIRGVTWDKHAQRWLARVGHGGVRVFVGSFTDLREAEKAVIAKRNELFTHNIADRAGIDAQG